MWRFVVLTCFAIPWITAQNPRNQRPFDNGHGWDIRLAVPGEPGNDYPTLDAIPRTSFTCSGKDPGYYADVETNCQVFRVCTLGSTYSFQSFICPNGTLFNQAVLVCDWWMKVNCKKSRELFETKKEKFVNLKLGTQFMTDIKKMISHPMRNPYDETYAKHNLIVMQEYKPPSNQFYNGASLNNFNRNPYSAYFQTNQAQRNNYQNSVQYSTADISTAASTPSTQYYTFSQNQKQSKPYQIPNRTGNLNNVNSAFTLNSHSGKSSQANSLDVIKYSQNSQSVRPTEVYQRSIQRTQPNKPQEKVKENIGSTYVTSNQKFNNSRLSKSKQIELGIEFSKQQLNRKINQEKFNSDKNTRARFLNVGQTGNDTKQNSDLVFSLLIDSINAAKDYNNIVQQSIATTQPTPTQPQFQNVNNEELQRISNDISQLTSSQFSAKNYSSNYRLANLRAPSPSDSTTSNTYGNTKNINSISQNQREQHRIPQQQHTPQQKQNELPPFQVSGNNELTDLNINSDKLYSGQLYQLPVPVVSKQIYNSLFPANYKLSNNDIQAKSSVENSANSNTINNNIINKSKADYEFIQSHTVDQNNFQSNYNSPKTTDQGSSANDFMNTLELPKNGITAQLQDNIVGTIPHPLDDDKLIKYKKDQTYYIYTHLNNDDELSTDTQINDIQNIIANNLASGTFSQNDKLSRLSAYELIPSLGYKLEDEREKQKTVNTFQINDYNEPKQRSSNENANLIRQQDIIATDVDFTVDHSKTANIEKPRFLYDGPNSYSAPQKSVGNLIPNQNSVQSVSNFNSKIEKFDTDEDKNYGYPKISPAKRFLF
ncbi:putative uncharacterized protein DDB_G0282129 isoform X2 [Maniola jurtina]|uniref:putative uncharacterized protein DDB_G0282129 isoform X2 n=1 Tax=Maniola jurtina TaxID=191418 RepID=UPI001E68859B|nr:putative uncharacterized protein DDB_G0282129 isoform X2 [Maniola jurtina]